MVVKEPVSHDELTITVDEVYAELAQVKDPEIPVISIQELGILQQVKVHDNTIIVGIIPTYSGCPAMHAIKTDIEKALMEKFVSNGLTGVDVQLLDDPVWNTRMISDSGRLAMQAYGIAPPLAREDSKIKCPQCHSENTTCISEFGSTACKALYRCESCLEPFDYFKCHV